MKEVAHQTAKYLMFGGENKYSRLDILNLADLPDDLYHSVTELKGSHVVSIKNLDKVRRVVKGREIMIELCKDRTDDEPFVITLPGKDFWKLKTSIYLGKCEMIDGVSVAIPELNLYSVIKKDKY